VRVVLHLSWFLLVFPPSLGVEGGGGGGVGGGRGGSGMPVTKCMRIRETGSLFASPR
jgi:hypothetical protein